MYYENALIDNKYQLIKEIGQGGTGVVYLAYHTTLQKYVVLKKLKTGAIDSTMLRREADLLKNLHHTYLPTVYDFLVVGNEVFTVIDYIDGRSLEDVISSGEAIEQAVIRKWFTQLAEVVCYLHEQQPSIIHSDIKPANIIITTSGDICLIDFNISLDGSADVSGYSTYYASPEQSYCAKCLVSGMIPDNTVDARTDIYSMGATFYHVISGMLPPDGAPAVPLTELLQTNDVFLSIVDRCMAFYPEDRYPTAEQLLIQLRDIFKLTSTYRTLNIIRWLAVTLGTAAVCAGMILFVYGSQLKQSDNFKNEYDSIFRSFNEQRYDETISKGIKLLNSSTSDSYLAANRSLKADMLHLVGSSYFEQEDYVQAAQYEKMAFDESGESNGEWYCEYLTSLIRSGDILKAQEAFEHADSKGLYDFQLDMIRMEFLISESKDEALLSFYNEKKDDKRYSDNDQVLSLCAEASTNTGRYSDALEFCKRAYSKNNSYRNLRRLGIACVDMANECIRDGKAAEAKSYSMQAEEYFRELTEKKFALSTDFIYLLECYRQLDLKNEAASIIGAMTEKFPNDYTVYAEIARYYSKVSQSSLAADYAKRANSLMSNIAADNSGKYEKYRELINELLR